jgi:hypothetical protein
MSMVSVERGMNFLIGPYDLPRWPPCFMLRQPQGLHLVCALHNHLVLLRSLAVVHWSEHSCVLERWRIEGLYKKTKITDFDVGTCYKGRSSYGQVKRVDLDE